MKFSPRQLILTLFLCGFLFDGSLVVGQSLSQAPASAKSQSLRGKFEKIATQLEFFDLAPFIYNREGFNIAPAGQSAGRDFFQFLNQTTGPEIPIKEIAALRHHADAKVRTLALAALYQRNDPQLLPLIVELTGDNSPTFPTHGLWSRLPGSTDNGPPPLKQSVSDVANAMVNFYLEKAGFNYGVKGNQNNPGFALYWAQRKDRKFSASWYDVELARACRGISPTQPAYYNDIRAVRKRIDALPAADRDWTLLYLNGETGSDVLVSESELIAAAKRRGADELLLCLRGKIPSPDPDMQNRSINNWPYVRLMSWILARADQLLKPEMADLLLEYESLHGWQLDKAIWYIAAARLQPQRGHEILKAGWTRFNDRFDGNNHILLMAALAELGDAGDFESLSEWYFKPSPAEGDGTSSMGKQKCFFDQLPHQGASPGTRQLIARLLKDERFDSQEFWAVYSAAQLINGWLPAPVVDTNNLFQECQTSDELKKITELATALNTLRQTSAKWAQ